LNVKSVTTWDDYGSKGNNQDELVMLRTLSKLTNEAANCEVYNSLLFFIPKYHLEDKLSLEGSTGMSEDGNASTDTSGEGNDRQEIEARAG
jgi:hypothetical protein